MLAIENFLKVVSKNEFVEGHEVLEELWHLYKKCYEKENEGKILKGLINASTALALASKGKMDGAQRVWQTFEKYRPLLRTTPCKDLPLYQEAEALLDMKKRLFM
ncbi:MAG: DUF309 domain-containing protein [Sulfurospirillaceae bacterium]|nr:DUF309 domain-containing protein [Sulfurospirillaceae bacterium]MDD2825563.1 DUF309 domain-containing protein [Sulfurospirillaceae bacterium]